jgi:hypothetical protein
MRELTPKEKLGACIFLVSFAIVIGLTIIIFIEAALKI